MKSFAVASVLLAAVAVAQPHGHQHRRHHEQHHEKRALVTHVEWVTETQYVTKLVDSTTTVWVSSGSEAEPTSTTEQAQFIETPKKAHKQKPTTTSTTTSTSVYVAPVEPTTTSTTSTSIYVAPPPSSTSVVEEVEQPTTSSVYVPPTTTSVYVPPTTTSVYVAPTTTKEEPVVAATTASSSDESSGGSGGSYSGDITYFTIGRGSCGDDDGGLDNSIALVALSQDLMTSSYTGNPNANPNCGKTITITANGKSTTAIVKDTCPECALGSIDVSEKVFNTLFGGLGKGRGECSWSFN